MKRQGSLYHRVCDFGNLLLAARKAQKGKRFKTGCRNFNLNLEKNLLVLQNELKSKNYLPGPYKRFKIYEPKERIISAAPYRDRVVHHALVNIIEPIFDRAMIFDSYANRKGKSTHKAVERFTQFARKRRYVLKMDIVRYFPNIDHKILMEAVKRKIKDQDVLWLVQVILASGRESPDENYPFYFPGDGLFDPFEREHGLPIGNLTSQLLANVYLDGFDHHVKERLGCHLYIRYMDDMVVFDDSKMFLHEVRLAMIEALERLRLKVHLNKAQIRPVLMGTDWLGYRVFPTHRLVRKSNVQRFRRRLRRQALEYQQSLIGLEEIRLSIIGWIGHVRHADSYRLRCKTLSEVPFQRGEANYGAAGVARRFLEQ